MKKVRELSSEDCKEVVVSICCITYNHVSYIEEAIESFLNQEVDFGVEILINDDASVDGTSQIIVKYTALYPHIIKPIIQDSNQYSKGVRGMNISYNFPRCKGKYIALCEGDDYWTYEKKLLDQVNYLENHVNYAMCFHNALVIDDVKNVSYEFNNLEIGEVTGKEVLQRWIVPTASVVFRSEVILTLQSLDMKNIIFGDIVMFLGAIEYGKAYYISKESWSVYRKHVGGVTFKKKITEKHYLDFISHYEALDKLFYYKYRMICYKIRLKSNLSLLRYYIKERKLALSFKQVQIVFKEVIKFISN
ncbi:glycosyltransferase [Myroides odoratimimus]|uniref:glycosyltransferase n=1 Tax=Myroides odoratimimus TaxID=76832 RepID=UPI0025763111|nr:glycosyltransferase [Myroides odoratimimus]MDM1096706.1 glycosyltransferase [Myroides odoratimimus]